MSLTFRAALYGLAASLCGTNCAPTNSPAVSAAPPQSPVVAVRPAQTVRPIATAFDILLVNLGISVKFVGRNVAEGCSALAPGLTVPKLADVYDFPSLVRCLSLLRAAKPEELRMAPADNDIAGITANPGTRYDEIVRTMQALHAAGIGTFQIKVVR